MSYLSLSTWSLHRNLGPLHWTVWDEGEKKHRVQIEPQPETVKLVDLPAVLASKGFKAFEICHFHFPNTESDYLQALRSACKEANIKLHTLLIDYGDLTTDDEVRRDADMQFIKEWIDIAGAVGAERVRVIAGDADPGDEEALARSSHYLNELVEYGKTKGVGIITENFRSLTSTADNCLEIVRSSNEQIGLTTDFGNFGGPTKYEEIAKILPYSESVHAKANFDSEGLPDEEEFRKCLDLLAPANYDGSLTLIYDGPGDMWEGIDRVRKIVETYL
ncbi:sugar phosphate isomerase/epimerase family protein [Lederbergia citrea]|uniref:sugar phosphate isomerase/epimerase family protein n=1 Tax=Lederbergia citrea TaxID=2833581 RepID=UPI001BCA19B6|nr:sugar phosphate isomerase/epimerase family protein [Lederbergia citrea]MBS4177356.1 sugar phosphate isomerase/epimerase [Lederbergia citrea]